MNKAGTQTAERLLNLEKLANNAGQPIQIMLVEDEDNDILLTQNAFRKSKIHNELIVCQSIASALSYFNENHPPDVVLLDLGFPISDGREFIRAVRARPEFRRIPIIITTIDSNPEVEVECLNLGANYFLKKPVDFNFIIQLVQVHGQFKFLIVKEPGGESAESKALTWETRKLMVFELQALNERVAILEDRAAIKKP